MTEEIFLYIIIALLGLLVGSFLNAVIYRLKSGDSIVKERSKCPSCKQKLGPIDLVPIFSFLFLKGKCRFCKVGISWQYPIIELVTMGLFILGFYRFGLTPELPAFMVLTGFMIIIFTYDVKHYLILDKVTIPGMVVALLFAIFIYQLSFWSIFFGALIGGGIFWLQYVLSKGKWVGGGDIRLGLMMGLFLGWEKLLVALFIAYVLGAIIGIFMIIGGKKGMKDALPFGTFLSASAVVVLLYGQEIINWYLKLL